jgi:hypothetical protein
MLCTNGNKYILVVVTPISTQLVLVVIIGASAIRPADRFSVVAFGIEDLWPRSGFNQKTIISDSCHDV